MSSATYRAEGARLIALVRNALMAGTMIGTSYTMSGGLFRLPGDYESYTTAGLIAFATDAVVTLCAVRLGELDTRIMRVTKKSKSKIKREAAQATAELPDFQAKRRNTIRAFALAGLISAGCNVYYNFMTKGNLLLALIVGIVPIIMVAIVSIFLRPLPVDHDDLAKDTTKSVLREVVAIAGAKVHRAMAQGKDLDKLSGHLAVLEMYADPNEIYGLKRAAAHTGAIVEAERVVSDRMLTSNQIASEWGISKRAAQLHMANMPERTDIPGAGLAVPESAYRAKHGDPIVLLAAPKRARRAKKGASDAQPDASDAQPDASETQAERETALIERMPAYPALGVAE